MKTILNAALLLTGLSGTAQELANNEVPATVMSAFATAFPQAVNVEWSLRGTDYKAEFDLGATRKDHEARYDASGRLLTHEEEIPIAELPAIVLSAIERDHPGHALHDAERNTAAGAVTYEVEVRHFDQEWEVIYDTKGRQLQKIADR